jgi:hypothetical protein
MGFVLSVALCATASESASYSAVSPATSPVRVLTEAELSAVSGGQLDADLHDAVEFACASEWAVGNYGDSFICQSNELATVLSFAHSFVVLDAEMAEGIPSLVAQHEFEWYVETAHDLEEDVYYALGGAYIPDPPIVFREETVGNMNDIAWDLNNGVFWLDDSGFLDDYGWYDYGGGGYSWTYGGGGCEGQETNCGG